MQSSTLNGIIEWDALARLPPDDIQAGYHPTFLRAFAADLPSFFATLSLCSLGGGGGGGGGDGKTAACREVTAGMAGMAAGRAETDGTESTSCQR